MKHISKLIIVLAAFGLLVGCGSDKKSSKPLTLEQQLLKLVTDGEHKDHKYARITKLLLEGALYPGDKPLKIITTKTYLKTYLDLGCSSNNGDITFEITIHEGNVDLNESNLADVIIKSIGVQCSLDDDYYGIESRWRKEIGVWVYKRVTVLFDKVKPNISEKLRSQ